MTSNFNKELDLALRTFIAEPDNFLDSLSLVNSLHSFSVLASDKPYAIAISGQKVTPVFTDERDLQTFKQQQASAQQQHWIERPSLEVLEEVIHYQLDGLIYNVKKEGDFANTTVFKTNEMVDFVTTYTNVINTLFDEENETADLAHKYYLVPVFIQPQKKNSFKRHFPTLSQDNQESYLPIFTNLSSFAKWYNHADFGLPFRQEQGVVLTWQLSDIYSSDNQQGTETSQGVVVNPFDDDFKLLDWETIGNKD